MKERTAESYAILDEAYQRHGPAALFALFSGGYDSLVCTHLTMTWASLRGVYRQRVAHINTRTGVEETRQYVYATARAYDWPLVEYRTPERYENLVLERGFPSPAMHPKMYDRLKGRCIDQIERDYPGTLIFATGVRRAESQRRMGYTHPVDVRGRQVWVNPCLFWTKDDVLDYKELHQLPSNPVVDLLHRSGECNCGCMAQSGELEELTYWFPATARYLQQIDQRVRRAGYPWGWGEGGPPKWWGKVREGQLLLPDPDEAAPRWMPLCVGCEGRNADRVTEHMPEVLASEGVFVPRNHIVTVNNISARSLARQPLDGDVYLRRIAAAAQVLRVTAYKDFQYVTSYISGTTVWRAPTGERSVSVRVDGSFYE